MSNINLSHVKYYVYFSNDVEDWVWL